MTAFPREVIVYSTTGLSTGQFLRVVELIRQHHRKLDITPRARGWHEPLTFERRVYLTICYLRLNVTEAALAEFFNTSQPTVSRVIATFTPAVAAVLAPLVPVGDDLDPNEQLIIDGTLLPTWSWRDQQDLWSGKHKRTGINVQVAVDHAGNLVWVGDPLPGSTHDAKAIKEAGILGRREDLPEGSVAAKAADIGDKGYVGLGMLTPAKKPPKGELRADQLESNSAINSVRAVVEREIGNVKSWRVLHTDYRRPLGTFVDTISAVLGLQFLRLSEAL